MDDFKSSALTTKRFLIAVDAFIYKMHFTTTSLEFHRAMACS